MKSKRKFLSKKIENLVFILFLFITQFLFSQIKSGVYECPKMYKFTFEDGKYLDGGLVVDENTYIHIAEYGMRIYVGEDDAGNTYPYVYMGKDSEGWETYGVFADDKIEYKDGKMVFYYDFDKDSGYYTHSTEFIGMEYSRRKPNLEIKE